MTPYLRIRIYQDTTFEAWKMPGQIPVILCQNMVNVGGNVVYRLPDGTDETMEVVEELGERRDSIGLFTEYEAIPQSETF